MLSVEQKELQKQPGGDSLPEPEIVTAYVGDTEMLILSQNISQSGERYQWLYSTCSRRFDA